MKASSGARKPSQEKRIGSRLLEMVSRFYEGIFAESAEEQVPKILKETAEVFEADIATWFLVTEDRSQLHLVDVFNDLGEATVRPPAIPYKLDWDAASEKKDQGLTAWVAISGEPMYVPSVQALEGAHKAHVGRWDKWLYPQGIYDPRSGFLCMYAVPLVIPSVEPQQNQVSSKNKIVGVLKMERRNTKGEVRRRPFTKTDLQSFNIIARIMGFAYFHSERQKSLTLADIGHALIRPLGDVAFCLDTVSAELSPDTVLSERKHICDRVSAATTMLRSLAKLLSLAKESYNQPLQSRSFDISGELAQHLLSYSLTSGVRVTDASPETIGALQMTNRSFAALMNIAVNLIDNAARSSSPGSEVKVSINRDLSTLVLTIENPGVRISKNTIREASDETVTRDATPRFRGLPRSFQLAARNGWTLNYEPILGRNRFKLIIPMESEHTEEQYAK